METRARSWGAFGVLLGLALCAGGGEVRAQTGRAGGPRAGSGGLEITTGPDGVKVITNETAVEHVRRTAPRRVAVPNPDLELIIHRHSTLQQLDPELIQAVIQAESGYNVRALSNKGAMGLMQLMPATATELEVGDPYDPEENVRGGTTYLARLLHRYGRLEVALAAYNAGPTAVDRHDGVPPYRETHAYVRRVLRLYKGEAAAVDLASPASPVSRGRQPYAVRRPGKRLLLTTEAPR